MRFVEKIEHARLVGIRLDVNLWWDTGDPETGPGGCLVGMAAWTDRKTKIIPQKLFAAYPWLTRFVQFQGWEIPAYAAIESVSHLVSDRVITWREAYALIDQWEPRPKARARRRPRSRVEVQ